MAYVEADRNLPRSLDVQISLSRPQTESRTDLTILCAVGQNLGFLPGTQRVRFYSTIEAVEEDFIAGTEIHFAASAFFAQDPRPIRMAIGEIFLSATPAMLVAPAEYTATQIAALAAISDGSLVVDYNDGTSAQEEDITGIDFSGATELQDIVDAINAALGSGTGLECVIKEIPGTTDGVLAIQTIEEGDGVTIAQATDSLTGTAVATLLGLDSDGSGIALDGYTPTGIADELTSIQNAAYAASRFIYGWCFVASLRQLAYQTAAAAWVLPRTGVMSLVTADVNALNSALDTDIGSVVYATGNRRVELRYHTNTQQYPDISMMAYMLSVNYQLKDSTVTSKFKVLPGVSTEQLTETEWTVLQSKGYNAYTAIGNDARTNRDGNMASAGWWYDTVVNLDNFLEDLSVNVFNVFLRNKKVPYTRMGQMLLSDACRDTGAQYTYNGTFADREVADTTKKGGYSILAAVQVLLTPIANMSAADRSSRIGPPIEMICQEAGAIHSVAVNVEVVP